MPPLLFQSGSGESSSERSTSPVTVALTDNTSKKRTVSFYPQAMVYDHAHRNDLSYEEKCQTWYSKRELHLIQRGNEETIQWMIGGSKSADDGSDAEYYCSRGLEYKTTMGSLIRRKQRRDALEKILDYQYFAWESGIKVNPESLAKIYSFYSDHSSKVACLLASIDQQSLAEPEEDDPPDTPMEDSKIQKARGLAVAA